MQKGFGIIYILVGVLILGLVAGGAFYYGKSVSLQSTPFAPPTSISPLPPDKNILQIPPKQITPPSSNKINNWKNFQNTQVGFSLSYPNEFNNPVLPTGPIGPSPEATGKENEANYIFIAPSQKTFELSFTLFQGSLDEFIRNGNTGGIPPYKWTTDENVTVQIIEELQVGGTKAKWLKASYKNTSSNDIHQAIFFINKGYGFIFNTFDKLNQAEVEQILTTLKFTN